MRNYYIQKIKALIRLLLINIQQSQVLNLSGTAIDTKVQLYCQIPNHQKSIIIQE